jgi:hypothetical protein
MAIAKKKTRRMSKHRRKTKKRRVGSARKPTYWVPTAAEKDAARVADIVRREPPGYPRAMPPPPAPPPPYNPPPPTPVPQSQNHRKRLDVFED